MVQLHSQFWLKDPILVLLIAYDPAAPLYLLTYDEVEFIKAEYYLRAGNDAAAQTAYEAGITASMDRWGADIGAYLADPLVAWNGGVAKQKLIMEQKWASIFGQGVEAYAEVRRTGYPSRIFEYELEGYRLSWTGTSGSSDLCQDRRKL